MKYTTMAWLTLISIPAFGQSYFTAGGVRLGTENGLTIQQRIFKHTTVEGIVLSGFKTDYFSTGLQIQRHYPLLFKNFNIYTGIGLQSKRISLPEVEPTKYTGVSFSGGIELSVGRVNVSWDYKPVVYFGGSRAFQSESGLSLRYIFISNKTIKKHQRQTKRKKAKSKRNRKKENNRWNIFGRK